MYVDPIDALGAAFRAMVSHPTITMREKGIACNIKDVRSS
jgi:hypothetical protein